MKFTLISDMHVDFPQEKTPYDKFTHNVVVAGDTSNGLHGLKFLQKLRRKGFEVFAIDGNHEHYRNVNKGRSIDDTVDRFRQENPNTGDLDGIPIIGCNGWYPVRDGKSWYSYMNDGPNIIGEHAEYAAGVMNSHSERDYFFLKTQLENIKDKCVVVTHTAPCLETLNPDYEGHFSNEWYHNPLMYMLLEKYRDKILVWCHGHTHASCDKMVEGVRVVCNPRGYPRENPDWKPLTIEI